jgi:hypothetical protein
MNTVLWSTKENYDVYSLSFTKLCVWHFKAKFITPVKAKCSILKSPGKSVSRCNKYLLNCGIKAEFYFQESSGLETMWYQDLQMSSYNFSKWGRECFMLLTTAPRHGTKLFQSAARLVIQQQRFVCTYLHLSSFIKNNLNPDKVIMLFILCIFQFLPLICKSGGHEIWYMECKKSVYCMITNDSFKRTINIR